MIRFPCPQCGGVLEAFEYDSGKETNCLGCGYLVEVLPPQDDYFRFPCPSCGKRLKAKPEHSGKKTHCTNCGTRLIVPRPKGHTTSKPGPGHAAAVDAVPGGPSSTSSPVILVSSSSPSPENAHGADSKACPFCGEQVLAAAKKCKHCGETIDVTLRAAEEDKRTSEKKPNQASPWKIALNLTKIALTIPAVLAIALVGAVAGFLFVRVFMFDGNAERLWGIWWEKPDMREIIAAEFAVVSRKLLAGTFIGFVAGLIIAVMAVGKRK